MVRFSKIKENWNALLSSVLHIKIIIFEIFFEFLKWDPTEMIAYRQVISSGWNVFRKISWIEILARCGKIVFNQDKSG